VPDVTSVQMKNFLTDWGYTIPSFNNWSLSPRIQATYIYLTDEDRKVFASSPLSYLYQEVRLFPFLGLYNRQLLDIECHNPVSRLILPPLRVSAINLTPKIFSFNFLLSYKRGGMLLLELIPF
jgi:hypothetical protein